MTTVDVTKLSCEFVRAVKQLLIQQKYIAEPCLDSVYYYFSKYKLATSLVDCLTHEDECDLSIIANTIPIEPDPVVVITSCDDAAILNLSKSSKNCNYTLTLVDLDGNATSYPSLVIEDDTIYQSAKLKVKAVGCSETYYATVETGCVNLSNLAPVVCDETYKTHINLNFRLIGLPANSNGYIKTLRVYQTDTSGLLVNTPIDLNLAPSNIAAWTSCVDCSGISAAHLYFGHANWVNAFATLLDNVTYTLLGNLNSSFVNAISTNYVTIGSKIKHNPSGEWLGINKNDFRVQWVDADGTTITNVTPSITYSGAANFMADDFSIATTCGNITGRVVMSGGSASGFTESNFNQLVVANPTFNQPASIVNTVNPSCIATTLTASYTSPNEVTSLQWTNSDDDILSSEALSIVVTESGAYTFTVELDNSCIVDATITV